MTEPVTVYVRSGDPESALMLRHLEERGIEHRVRDVTDDPSASAVLFGRLGRIAVPALQVGDRMMVGYDPLQLARFLPSGGNDEPAVSFGAAVRGVSAELAHAHGLPYVMGVEVGSVREGTPAAEAGVRPGDLITQIGAYTLQGGADQFRAAVAARHPGDVMELTVRRGDADLVLAVEFPKPAPAGDPAEA
jgi:glutaredoxin